MPSNNRIITLVLATAMLLALLLTSGVSHSGASAQGVVEPVQAQPKQQEDPPQPLPTEKSQAAENQPAGSTEPLEANNAAPIDENGSPGESLPDTMSLEAHEITLPKPLLTDKNVVRVPAVTDAWTPITTENFEGTFPGPGWAVFDNDGATNGEYLWDDDNFKPYTGSWSGWPANGGVDGYSSSVGYYPNNADSWLFYGPFDLSDAVDAELLFYYWLDSELDYDYLGWYASTDGSSFHGYHTSGNSGGWLSNNFDLTTVPTLGDVTGQSNVWIAIIFTSDSSDNSYAGPFIDDILLQKDSAGGGGVNLSPYTPSGWDYPIVPSSNTGTNTVNDLYTYMDTYIDWAAANWGPDGISQTFYTCLYFDGSEMQCWSTSGLAAEYYTYVEDWVLNFSPSEGWHTLEIITDINNDVDETNESDNSWAGDFYWNDLAGPNCAAAISEFDEWLDGTTVPSTDNPAPEFMPPHPDLLERARRGEIQLPEFITNPELKQAKGIDQPSGLALGPTGSWRALAILVEFTDNPSAVGATFFDSLLYGTSFGDLRHYYQDVSYGTLDIVTVNLPSSIGWCMMPQTYAYYVDGNNGFNAYPRNAQKMAEDAVLVADPLVDYSQYDNDGDGWVDTVFIIHAGPGAEFTGSPDDIWSHSWSMANDPLVDGVRANGYTSEPEYWLAPGDMTSGVYAHELGHVFGLPDLYDTDYSSSGIGDWSLMASGSWNGTNGDSPAWPDAWSRSQLGFSPLTTVVGDASGTSIPAAETSPPVFYLSTDSIPGAEHYLVENRQPIGYDAALPGHGLLIWHIDENKSGNQSECDQLDNWNCGSSHLLVALEQADGLWDLEQDSDRGDSGDPYPGSTNNRDYNFSTAPNSSSYYHSSNTCISVNNVSSSMATMTADLSVSCTPPPTYLLSTTVNPAGSGSVNANPPPNAAGGMYIAGTMVTLTAVESNTAYEFGDWSGDIGGASPTANPITVTMDQDRNVTANFSLIPPDCYTLTTSVNPAGSGSVNVSPAPNCEEGKYIDGTVTTLTAAAGSGYDFDNWSGDIGGASSTANPINVTMDQDRNVTANFSLIPPDCYSLTTSVNPAGSGSVDVSPAPTCEGSKYIDGTVVTLTATAGSGYDFDNWSGDIGGASSTANPINVTMDQDRNVTANFNLIPPDCYTLTTSVNPAGSGSVNVSPAPNCEGSKYIDGTAVTLTATAGSGYNFDNWSGDIGGASSTANPINVTMDQDRNVTANFVLIGPEALLSVEPTDAEMPLNGEITVDIVASDISSLFAADIELHFDPTKVEVVDDDAASGIQITPGSCPQPDSITVNSVDNVNGIINYAVTSLSLSLPCDGGVVMSITFRGLALVEQSPLHFSDWLLSTNGSVEIPTSAQDGTLTVVDPLGAIEGTVLMQGRSDYSGAEVCAGDGGIPVCVLTGADGFYSIDMPGGSYLVTVEMERYLDGEKLNVPVIAGTVTPLPDVTCQGGDTNDDCVVNILDLSLEGGRFGMSCGDPIWDPRADINNDCTVNILDLAVTGGNYGKTCPVPWS